MIEILHDLKNQNGKNYCSHYNIQCQCIYIFVYIYMWGDAVCPSSTFGPSGKPEVELILDLAATTSSHLSVGTHEVDQPPVHRNSFLRRA